MTDWIMDISKAPRGRFVVKNRKFGKGSADTKVFQADKVLLLTKCGQEIVSQYLPDSKRWEGLATNEQPVAWSPVEVAA